jgi:hypothetical protein
LLCRLVGKIWNTAIGLMYFNPLKIKIDPHLYKISIHMSHITACFDQKDHSANALPTGQ